MSRYNESYPVSQDKGYNLLRSEKLPRYIMAAKGAKFSIADAEILAAYGYVRTILPEDLASIVVERKENPADIVPSGSIDGIAGQTIGLILGDLESHESALRIALTDLPAGASDADSVPHVTRNAQFIRDQEICRALAVAFVNSQKPLCAMILGRRAVELGPDEVKNHMLVGDVACSHQDWATAEAAYRQAIALDPTNVTGHAQLWTCLRELGRQEEAIAMAHRTLELSSNPSNPRAASGSVASGRSVS
jgi:tetratricopeptide (TPR) repeat protein